jgi:hypothetical protein
MRPTLLFRHRITCISLSLRLVLSFCNLDYFSGDFSVLSCLEPELNNGNTYRTNRDHVINQGHCKPYPIECERNYAVTCAPEDCRAWLGWAHKELHVHAQRRCIALSSIGHMDNARTALPTVIAQAGSCSICLTSHGPSATQLTSPFSAASP